jgi:spore coat protein CotH
MKVFFAGIIQGSNVRSVIFDQNYREKIKSILIKRYPNVEIFDPFEKHKYSVNYDVKRARQVFFMHLDELKSSDLMIAYLPQASLGTAIEMWEAYQNKIPIISISPMTANWIIRFLANRNFSTMKAFKRFVVENDLQNLLNRGQER